MKTNSKTTFNESHILEDDNNGGLMTGPVVGALAGSNNNGEVLVEFLDQDPRPAKFLASMERKELIQKEACGKQVLLLFENGDIRRPIIIGLLHDPLEKLLSVEVEDKNIEEPNEVLVDGKRVVIEANDEVLLKCGKGSILISQDGKIIIKGTHILSRSSGPNRVKGASVSIN